MKPERRRMPGFGGVNSKFEPGHAEWCVWGGQNLDLAAPLPLLLTVPARVAGAEADGIAVIRRCREWVGGLNKNPHGVRGDNSWSEDPKTRGVELTPRVVAGNIRHFAPPLIRARLQQSQKKCEIRDRTVNPNSTSSLMAPEDTVAPPVTQMSGC